MWIVVVCLFVNYSVDFEFHKRLISNTAQQVFLKWRRSKSTGSFSPFSFWRILLPSFSFFLSLSLCFVSYLSFHLSFCLSFIFVSYLSIVCFSFHFSFFLSFFSLPPLLCPPIPTPPPCRSCTPSLPLSLLSLWEVKLRNLSECCVFQRVRTVFSPAVLQPTAAPSQRNQHIITQSVSESVSQWSEPFRPVASAPTPRAGNQKVKKVSNLIVKAVKQIYVFGWKLLTKLNLT